MAIHLLLSLLLASLSVSFCTTTDNSIKSWCAQTPNPKPCEYFLANHRSIKQNSDFLKLSMQLAHDQAIAAHSNVQLLGPKCRNELERAAWSDCVALYEHTCQRLNQSLTTVGCTKEDQQTWLSTALTNLETCHAGFKDLGVSDNVWPIMSNNVSLLISNTLAINKNDSSDSNGKSGSPNRKLLRASSVTNDGFPYWLSSGDRKLLATSSAASQANLVVAQDGSGDYTTISDAVTAAGERSGTDRYIIYVKAGTYEESVSIASGVTNIMLVGDGIGSTIVTGSKSVDGGSTTFNSATVAVVGDGFIGQGITFRNTAGAANHQAVAFRSGSDLSVMYQCSFEGYQDTLYVYSDRQFYRDCDIYGTVDFIFGNAAVVIQNCNIYARYPPNKTNTITAQGRTDANQNTGISIHDCTVTAASDLESSVSSVKTYLGRPWKEYSRTVFMKTDLGSLINSAGWLEWDGDFALDTLYYGEYANTGAGSTTTGRVTWAGYHIMTETDASDFTVENFIAGNSWLPDTGVTFTAGL